jgi:hypothetical protein
MDVVRVFESARSARADSSQMFSEVQWEFS